MSTFRNAARALALGATMLLSLAGCGSSTDKPDDPVVDYFPRGDVTGRVTDAQTGQPIAGVEVKLGNSTIVTNAAGGYTLNVPMPKTAMVIQFSKPDYATTFGTVDVHDTRTSTLHRSLARVAIRKELSAAAGGVVTLANSPAQVTLPAAGLVTASGAAYAGAVFVEMTPIDPGVNPTTMPGNFRAQSEAVPIESMGALQVELRDAAGAKLNLAPGKTATIRIPVPAGASSPPLTMPLYYFNETTGLWVREGVATLAGSAPSQYYEGTVSHFTVWNADMPMDTIYINGCVVNASNQPRDATVTTEGIDYFGSSSVQTQMPAATFRVAARRNSRVQVNAHAGGEAAADVASVTVTTGATDLTLPSCIVLASLPPVIVQQPQSIVIAPGFFGTLQVVADHVSTYTWYRNGEALGFGDNALHLNGLPGTAGSYYVVVKNRHGSVTSATVTVSVSIPANMPLIASQPRDASVLAGAAPSFSVTASGDSLSYQWLRNGVEIAAAQGPELKLGAVTMADNNALFSVRVKNAVGTVTSDVARLTVLAEAVAPSITQQPSNVSAAVGQTATFAVGAAGTGPLSYQWLKNGVVIAGATEASYQTPLLALGDSGAQYAVRVTNSKGTVTSSAAALTVSLPSTVAGLHLSFGYGSPINSQLAYGAVPVGGGTPVPLEPAGQAEQVGMLVQGDINNGTASNFFVRSLLFWKAGNLVRRDLSGSAGLPPQTRVSSVTSANACGGTRSSGADLIIGNDVVNALRSWVVVQKSGTDGQCGTSDDQYLAVRADMTAADAPLQVARPELPIHSAQGALTGWLVRNGMQMQRVNADFANPVTLFTLPDEDAEFTQGSDLNNTVLFSAGDGVYAVDVTAPAPAALTRVATLAADETLTDVEQANEREIVVGLRRANQMRLLRYTIASKTAQAIGSVNGALDLTIVTPTRALVRSGSGALMSFPIAGGNPTEIAAGSFANASLFVHAGGERIWHEVSGNLVSVNSDGTGTQTLAGTRLAGCILRPQTQVWKSLPDCDAILAVTGASLRSYDAATGAARITYGNINVPNGQLTTGFYMGSLTAWGQTGVLTQFVANADFSQATYVNYLLKTDQAGLTPIVMP